MFYRAANAGSTNAKYNLGALFLSGDSISHREPENKVEFSFGKAYDWFSKAAEKGHTLAAYNVGLMHYLGLGTYQSCSLGNTFITHVAYVGQHVQLLKQAYNLVH